MGKYGLSLFIKWITLKFISFAWISILSSKVIVLTVKCQYTQYTAVSYCLLNTCLHLLGSGLNLKYFVMYCITVATRTSLMPIERDIIASFFKYSARYLIFLYLCGFYAWIYGNYLIVSNDIIKRY